MTVRNATVQDQANNATNKKEMFKNCASFTNCISRINNTQVDDAHDIDVVMPKYSFKNSEFYGNIAEMNRL